MCFTLSFPKRYHHSSSLEAISSYNVSIKNSVTCFTLFHSDLIISKEDERCRETRAKIGYNCGACQYFENFINDLSNSNKWLQSIGLQHLQSSTNPFPLLNVISSFFFPSIFPFHFRSDNMR
ncbi:hypothetical protein AAZX31_06G079800 [Glycine max]